MYVWKTDSKRPGMVQFQTPQAAREFYTGKVEELGKNLQDLEGIVQQKNGHLRIVEDGEFFLHLLPF